MRKYNRRFSAKIAAGALCAAMVLSCAACQDKEEKETTAESVTEEVTEAETEAKTDAAASEDGWYSDDKGRYFILNGKRQTGLVDLTNYEEIEEGLMYANAYIYAFDEDGYLMPEGWLELNGKKYYVTEEGWLYVSYAEIDGEQYVFNGIGEMATGLKYLIEGDELTLFYYDKETGGRVENAWETVGTETVRTFYFDENGKGVTGWQTIDGKKYYFGIDDAAYMLAPYVMVTGEMEIDGETYEFGEDGVLVEE